MFSVQNLSKTIKAKNILYNVGFEIERGQIGIFLGGSGVGKSTLLRVLNNLETYETGSFMLDGVSLKLTDINNDHTMGMVFQHFNLFENLNVRDNITLALTKVIGNSKQEAHQIASHLLERYELSEKANFSIDKLSGGQKQRLAIARTLALNPKIICMDEPTSALDPLLTAQIAKYMTDLANDGRIVLVATHDTGLVKQLKGKLFLMHQGSIVESCITDVYHQNPSHFPLLNKWLA